MFTGNLNATLDTNPAFPGRERHYLRSQIARITHSTVLIPKGIYELDEDTNEEKFAEEFSLPSFDELKSNEVWGHRHPNLLLAGRCSHIVPDSVPEDERDGYLENLQEKDKEFERYRAINEDV